jgi:hypothetical protein
MESLADQHLKSDLAVIVGKEPAGKSGVRREN